MKKQQLATIAIFVLPLVIWVSSAVNNDGIAGDHYRIGTLNESVHYKDNDEFNSTHNGLYLVHNRNVFGTYYNSEHRQSLFYARNNPINRTLSYSYGVVLGYNIGLMPMVALSAQFGLVKFTFTHEAAVVGLEFSLL